MQYSRFQIWLLAIRPKTLWAAVAPVMLGTAFAVSDKSSHSLSAVAALVCAILIQIGTNFANDYYDFLKGADTSARTGPIRVTQAGLVAPETMKRATMLVFTLALLVGIYLVYRGGWPILCIGLVSIACGYIYTAGPAPLAYKGLGELFVLIFFGIIAVAGTYYVQSLRWSLVTCFAGLSPGLLSVCIIEVNNLRDLAQDEVAGKRTLAVRIGRGNACMLLLLSLLLAHQVPVILSILNPEHRWALISLLTLVPGLFIVRRIFMSTDPAIHNRSLADMGKLLIAHSLLFSVGWLL